MMNSPTYIGRRIIAGLIDYSLIIGFTYAYIMHYGKPNGEGGYSVTGLPGLVPPLFWFIITAVIESLTGATIGNGIVWLRPVCDNDMKTKPGLFRSFKRHLPDLIDMSFFGLVGILLIRSTSKRQRLGDLWAKTIVIKDPSKKKQAH